MYRRVVAAFSAFCLLLGMLSLRVLQVQNSAWASAAAGNNTRTVLRETMRGSVYDCNMQLITYSQSQTVAAVKPTKAAIDAVSPYLSKEERASLYQKLADGYPATVPVPENTKIDNADVTLIHVKRRYTSDALACHILGYVGGDSGDGETGIEKSFNTYLKQHSGELRVSYTVDANGRLLNGDTAEVTDTWSKAAAGVSLTIDREIQRVAEQALNANGITAGSVVVLDTASGGVRAIASRPVFDATNVAKSLNDPAAPFVNRALSAYAVGSVFKAVVAAAAVEAGIGTDFTYTCTGSAQKGNTVFHCHEHNGHGTIAMKNAMAQSCNTYFIELAEKIGAQAIVDMAGRLGFGKQQILADAIAGEKGMLPNADELQYPAALANFAFGQGTLMATPLQVAAAFNAVASGGMYYTPTLVRALVDEQGKPVQQFKAQAGAQAMSTAVAETIRSFLEETVRTGSGKGAASEQFSAAGKTATAQSGWYENGVEIDHSWFAGFFPAQAPKYTIVIMKENGISGGLDCAPVFKDISEGIHALGR